jgi:hypothetical protein
MYLESIHIQLNGTSYEQDFSILHFFHKCVLLPTTRISGRRSECSNKPWVPQNMGRFPNSLRTSHFS